MMQLILAVVHEVHRVDLALGLRQVELVEVVVLGFLEGLHKVVHGMVLAALI